MAWLSPFSSMPRGRALASTLSPAATPHRRPVTTERSEALLRIEQAVAQIYASGSVRAAHAVLADNLLLDRSALKRDQELAALRVRLGACQAESKPDVKHALSAVLKYPCERGTLVATVLLAPVGESSLQRLEFSAPE